MKICVIHSIFSPYTRGGAEHVVEAMAKGFSREHEVIVITCAPFEGVQSFAGKWERLEMQNEECRMKNNGGEIRVFRFTPLNLFTIFNIAKYPPLLRLFWHCIDMFNPHTYLVVRRILREEKPDLIITRNLKGLGYTVPLAIRRYTLHATRYTPKWFHGLHDLNALHPYGQMILGKESAVRGSFTPVLLYRVIARWLFGSPEVVVSPSQFLLDEYGRAGFFPQSKKVVVRNPVMRDGGVAHESTRRCGLSAATPITRFLYLGQLEIYKGLEVLFDAWREFVREYPFATLQIVGKGRAESYVRRAITSIHGVSYRGFISHDQLSMIFKEADYTIVPSLSYEPFGLVIAESMMEGVPVIGSRIAAIQELVNNGKNGFLFTAGDHHALCAAMRTAVAASWDTLSREARASAEAFALPRYIAIFEHLYRSQQETGAI